MIIESVLSFSLDTIIHKRGNTRTRKINSHVRHASLCDAFDNSAALTVQNLRIKIISMPESGMNITTTE
jgi:hypothetical protein